MRSFSDLAGPVFAVYLVVGSVVLMGLGFVYVVRFVVWVI